MGKRKRGEEKPKLEGEYDLPVKALKSVHSENKKRLIVILHGSQMETVKVKNYISHVLFTYKLHFTIRLDTLSNC